MAESKIHTVGAGWKRETKKGVAYLRINLDVNKLAEFLPSDAGENGAWLNLFRVKNKKSEKAPDYTLVVFTDSENASGKQEEDENEPF